MDRISNVTFAEFANTGPGRLPLDTGQLQQPAVPPNHDADGAGRHHSEDVYLGVSSTAYVRRVENAKMYLQVRAQTTTQARRLRHNVRDVCQTRPGQRRANLHSLPISHKRRPLRGVRCARWISDQGWLLRCRRIVLVSISPACAVTEANLGLLPGSGRSVSVRRRAGNICCLAAARGEITIRPVPHPPAIGACGVHSRPLATVGQQGWAWLPWPPAQLWGSSVR